MFSAGALLRERQFCKHESLKGRQFVITIIIAMVRLANIVGTSAFALTLVAGTPHGAGGSM